MQGFMVFYNDQPCNIILSDDIGVERFVGSFPVFMTFAEANGVASDYANGQGHFVDEYSVVPVSITFGTLEPVICHDCDCHDRKR